MRTVTEHQTTLTATTPIRTFHPLETVHDLLKLLLVNFAFIQRCPRVVLVRVAQAQEQMESTLRIAIADEVFPFGSFLVPFTLLMAEGISTDDHRIFFEKPLPAKQLQRAFRFVDRDCREFRIDGA